MKKVHVGSGVLFMCLFILSSYAETTLVSLPIRNRFSIGVNNLPWDASQASFRWWKNEKSGCEFIIGTAKLEMSGRFWQDTTSSLDIFFSELSYSWLKRNKTSLLENFYITHGIGLSLPFSISMYKSKDRSEYYEYYRFYKSIYTYIPFPLKITCGIEHFFIKNYPVSYSLQTDFRVGLYYNYRYEKYDSDISEYSGVRYTASIKPCFFLRLYLR